jgi:UDP-N-acetylglucosamine 1-carboxyvinyltransferase
LGKAGGKLGKDRKINYTAKMKIVIDNKKGHFDICGQISLQGSKNSMLNNLCLPLLTNEECIIENVPDISDIRLNIDCLEALNAKVNWINKNQVSIQCDEIVNKPMNPQISSKTTGSKFFIPLMVQRFGEYYTGASGGCNIGDRVFENYAKSLEPFGIAFQRYDNLYRFYKTETMSINYTLPFPSFGLTVNAILSCVFKEEEITIANVCLEPEIDNTIEMLNNMGIKISRFDTSKIKIIGNPKPVGCMFRNMSDRNAAVSFAIMALITNSTLEINNFDNIKMDAFYAFLDAINAQYKASENKLLILKRNNKFHPISIKAFLYPDFHSDWQPLIAPLLTQIEGNSSIEEMLFPDRLKYWIELGKMNAKYNYNYKTKSRFTDTNPHYVETYGIQKLNGTEVYATDLRGGMSLIIASLIAQGKTIINNAKEINRGYENIVELLKSLNVNIFSDE